LNEEQAQALSLKERRKAKKTSLKLEEEKRFLAYLEESMHARAIQVLLRIRKQTEGEKLDP
jgi:hypothetical protein